MTVNSPPYKKYYDTDLRFRTLSMWWRTTISGDNLLRWYHRSQLVYAFQVGGHVPEVEWDEGWLGCPSSRLHYIIYRCVAIDGRWGSQGSNFMQRDFKGCSVVWLCDVISIEYHRLLPRSRSVFANVSGGPIVKGYEELSSVNSLSGFVRST